jgi:DNA-binding MarR family transcriptional regulator
MTVDSLSGPKAFEGDLAGLPLPELLQFIHISGRDGVLVVTDETGRPRAVLHYAEASIVHATCDGIIGREAVFAAVAFNSGRFEFFTGTAARVERTIDDNVQNLILEGLRRLDELSHVTSLLPADHEPLFVSPEPPHDDIRLTAKEWRILSLVNGKRSVRQIIETSGRDESDVRASLACLLAADLIVDRRDDSYLDAIVPRHLRQDEAGTTRYAPPTLAGNLLLKSCDGRRTARQIMAEMRMDERQLLEELKLLERTRWIAFAAGADVFQRLAQE